MPFRSREEAFCAPEGPEIFHAVASRHEIWREDPFDVVSIHPEARAVFERLLHLATTPPGTHSGRLLLLLGESGCGKTHLMRTFRNYVHGQRYGYVGYMQMTSSTSNYGAYILSNLIDSLDKPYFESLSPTSGLMVISNALAADQRLIPTTSLEQLRESELSDLPLLIHALADNVLCDERFSDVDLELVRALLYLQRDDPRIKSRVLRYLRCEDLTPADRALLGGIVPRVSEDDPQRQAEQLGRLVWQLEASSLVVCVDQLEDIYNLEASEQKFRRAMARLCSLADQVPSSIVVISCLEDYYTELRGRLTRSMTDRIETNPEPVTLESRRTAKEIQHLVAQRLEVLWDALEVPFDPGDPTFPFSNEMLRRLEGTRTRDVLLWCRRYREQCVNAGRLVEPAASESETVEGRTPPDKAGVGPEVDSFEAVVAIEQLWNEFQNGQAFPLPEEDTDLVVLLAWAIEACSGKGVDGDRFMTHVDGLTIEVESHTGSGTAAGPLIGLCNMDARGGHLGRQVEAVTTKAWAEGRVPVIARSTAFPNNPKTKIAQQIAELITRGGRRVVIEDSDWRTMQAFREFEPRHSHHSHFAMWVTAEKPLGRLPSLRHLLHLDEPKTVAQTAIRDASEKPAWQTGRMQTAAMSSVPMQPSVQGGIEVGRTADLAKTAVTLKADELTHHAAFLGGSGSGKTSLALHLIEQLLLRGIPAILVDRKGDLCTYAFEHAWNGVPSDEARHSQRSKLHTTVDVALYTPGVPQGRPLSISIVPEALSEMPANERQQIATFAAFSLGSMMGYSQRGLRDKSCVAILATGIRLFTEYIREEVLTLDRLITFIDSKDASLVGELGRLDGKLFSKLVQDLETLRLINSALFSGEHARLDIDALLGKGQHVVPGRTRLTILSTKFLGDNANICFWVAQLLSELGRWISRRPADHLQAVVLFDEADLYLPAQSRPPTKEPMEHLLKRARSGGLGIFLVTQSPGDLDYKCRDNVRTWFVGRVKEQTALNKMKPMLSECRIDVTARLPVQGPGEFHVMREGEVKAIRAHRNLVLANQVAEEEILAAARESDIIMQRLKTTLVSKYLNSVPPGGLRAQDSVYP
jgi:hypothetical protein